MFEDHNGDRLAAPVVEPHAVSPYILGHLPDESLDRTLPVRILRGFRTRQARNGDIKRPRGQVLDAGIGG